VKVFEIVKGSVTEENAFISQIVNMVAGGTYKLTMEDGGNDGWGTTGYVEVAASSGPQIVWSSTFSADFNKKKKITFTVPVL